MRKKQLHVTLRNAVRGDNIKIRPLQEEIATVHYEGRPDLFKREARYYSDEAFEEKLNNPDNYIFIAELEGGEVAGYAFANVLRYRGHSTHRDYDSFYIDDICVLEKYRRRGIGGTLFEKCRETAVSLKCHNVDLGVFAFNRSAVAFYKKCGMNERMVRMELKLEE